MRKTLVINSGSSSLKFSLFTMPNYDVDCEGIIDRIGIDGSSIVIKFNGEKIIKEQSLANHEEGIQLLLELFEEHKIITNKEVITKVGHRVVQGGEEFKESAIIDSSNIEKIYELAKLAPLHNKPNADGIKIFSEILPHAINVATFDTEFHQSLPAESYLYAVPYSWYEDYSVRRYGMHGTSHKYISIEAAKLENNDNLKLINCHLGNGASLAAIDGGKCIQTSMGLTPLAGIMMGTRSGDIDPSIIEYMVNQTGKTVQEIISTLNKESGMLGLSGISSDFRDIGDAIEDGNEDAIRAMDVYVTRILETIGSYWIRLGGLDLITFTGGIGENDDIVRSKIIQGLEGMGLKLDDEANKDRSKGDRVITTEDSSVKVRILSTDEEYQIANEAEKF